jgi:hypothetical protein
MLRLVVSNQTVPQNPNVARDRNSKHLDCYASLYPCGHVHLTMGRQKYVIRAGDFKNFAKMIHNIDQELNRVLPN